MTDPPILPAPAFAPGTPSPAGMYDYFLGGKNNCRVDREAADKVLAAHPEQRILARLNRAFLVQAVRFMAECGIRQFLDLGAGFPTSPSVHEVAREIFPDAKVAYVDSDRLVVRHNQALLAGPDGVLAVEGDLRRPKQVLADPDITDLFDLDQPIAVLLIAVLHFVPTEQDSLVRDYLDLVAPGSYLALSTATSDGLPAETIRAIETAYDGTTAPTAVFRTGRQVAELFRGLDLVKPGIVPVSQWRAHWLDTPVTLLCGVGRKP